jgi:hypothetical protein
MAIRLPQDLRSFRFTKLVPFELNDAQIDTLLPVLFQRVILGNRDLSSLPNDASDIRGSVERLANQSSRLSGFSSAETIDTLERIVRTALVSIGYKGTGRRKSDQQMNGLMPLTIGTFKVGFPKERTRMRGIDLFVYDLLLDRFRGNEEELLRDFMDTFGQGVEVSGFPEPNAERRPGPWPHLDVLTELSIAYVDGFNAVKPRSKKNVRTVAQPLPEFQRRFGEDIHRFLKTYQTRVPVTLLTEQLVTLIAFEITIMSVEMFYAIPALVQDHDSDPGLSGIVRAEIYVDFTGDPRHFSRLMAQRCVQRDRSQIDPFIDSVLYLKYLNREVTQLRRDREFCSDVEQLLGSADCPKPTIDYMRGLLSAVESAELRAEIRRAARATVKAILIENADDTQTNEEFDDEEPRWSQEADEILRNRDNPLDQVRAYLTGAQTPNVRSSVVRWLSAVGGVGKPYGLIQAVSDRRSWAYTPPNDLLSILVQLCATDYMGWHPGKSATPRHIKLPVFLEWLEYRFGIIIDRPPANLGFDSPEHMAAARENFQRMLTRLHQMGIFEDRSDDFSVQELTPPFLQPAEVHRIAVEGLR